jgi:hypothetical protein
LPPPSPDGHSFALSQPTPNAAQRRIQIKWHSFGSMIARLAAGFVIDRIVGSHQVIVYLDDLSLL